MQKSPTTRTIAPPTADKPRPVTQLKLHQETIAGRNVVQDDLGALRTGLKAFRHRTPRAVVAMANAYPEHGTLRTLQSSNLLDHVDNHDVFSIPFLLKGVEVFMRRQDLQ
jgi:hypothetical protein